MVVNSWFIVVHRALCITRMNGYKSEFHAIPRYGHSSLGNEICGVRTMHGAFNNTPRGNDTWNHYTSRFGLAGIVDLAGRNCK